MDIEQIHPQFRDTIKRFPRLPVHSKLMLRLINWGMRFSPAADPEPSVLISHHRVGDAAVRVYRPLAAASGAALLWIHGGGLVMGHAGLNARECMAYARDLGLVVVSAGYRLAPKYPFPAASDDCLAAWQWLQERAAEFGIDATRVAVSGQSAGAGLAASLVQRLHDQSGIPPAGQALLNPMLDDRTGARRDLDAMNHRVWNNRNNRAGWSFYLGQPAGADTVPAYAVAARRQDLSGLPPAWIGIGECDLFYQESCDYAERLRDAGVPCTLEVVPQAPHGFEVLVPEAPLSQAFFQSNYRFLTTTLALSDFLDANPRPQ